MSDANDEKIADLMRALASAGNRYVELDRARAKAARESQDLHAQMRAAESEYQRLTADVQELARHLWGE